MSLLPEPVRLIQKQLPDGSWKYPGKSSSNRFGISYDLLETFPHLLILVDRYAFNRSHPCLQGTVEYVIPCQMAEGEIRGILSNQYMPHYMGAILSLVIKAGFGNDERTIKGLEWRFPYASRMECRFSHCGCIKALT